MDASDQRLIAALTGGATTRDELDRAVALRGRFAPLRTAIGHAAAMLPPDGGSWRSQAADRYAARVHALRAEVLATIGRLDDAAAELDECIRRLGDLIAEFEAEERAALAAAEAARVADHAEQGRMLRVADEQRHAA
ncbi:hypothetical protein MUN74_09125 [Agromyces endophyticus]|uniref:hypothetical protein n=1 Tax=Agromyces sp. H17E-10 TaxID=2932244 RepID=UPI001FD17E6C|nr:hypothetical protein [Agromyces sp. H17E-10]UOQ91031.1 hypothetical protein MUN74_09125 [Agromyces sp. H17E-10]